MNERGGCHACKAMFRKLLTIKRNSTGNLAEERP